MHHNQAITRFVRRFVDEPPLEPRSPLATASKLWAQLSDGQAFKPGRRPSGKACKLSDGQANIIDFHHSNQFEKLFFR